MCGERSLGVFLEPSPPRQGDEALDVASFDAVARHESLGDRVVEEIVEARFERLQAFLPHASNGATA